MLASSADRAFTFTGSVDNRIRQIRIGSGRGIPNTAGLIGFINREIDPTGYLASHVAHCSEILKAFLTQGFISLPKSRNEDFSGKILSFFTPNPEELIPNELQTGPYLELPRELIDESIANGFQIHAIHELSSLYSGTIFGEYLLGEISKGLSRNTGLRIVAPTFVRKLTIEQGLSIGPFVDAISSTIKVGGVKFEAKQTLPAIIDRYTNPGPRIAPITLALCTLQDCKECNTTVETI